MPHRLNLQAFISLAVGAKEPAAWPVQFFRRSFRCVGPLSCGGQPERYVEAAEAPGSLDFRRLNYTARALRPEPANPFRKLRRGRRPLRR